MSFLVSLLVKTPRVSLAFYYLSPTTYPPPTDHSLGLKVSITITSTTSNLCLWKVPCHLPKSSSNATSSSRPSLMTSLHLSLFWSPMALGIGFAMVLGTFLPLDSELLEGRIHVWFISGSPVGLSPVITLGGMQEWLRKEWGSKHGTTHSFRRLGGTWAWGLPLHKAGYFLSSSILTPNPFLKDLSHSLSSTNCHCEENSLWRL